MRKKIVQGVLVLGLSLIGSGCNSRPVQVNQTAPVEIALSKEIIELRNCERKTEMQRSLADELEVISQIIIAEEAIAITTGETVKLSTAMNDRLVDQVKTTYQQDYE